MPRKEKGSFPMAMKTSAKRKNHRTTHCEFAEFLKNSVSTVYYLRVKAISSIANFSFQIVMFSSRLNSSI